METTPTNYFRPEFDLEHESIDPKTTRNGSAITPFAVECCGCHPSNTSICAVENDAANVLGSSIGYVGTFWFM